MANSKNHCQPFVSRDLLGDMLILEMPRSLLGGTPITVGFLWGSIWFYLVLSIVLMGFSPNQR